MHASATRVVGEYAIDRVQRPRPEAPQLQVRIQMLARLALIGVAFGWRAMFGTAAADETPKPAREKAVAACAEIPVRFNGRVTTLDVAATHWLRSLAETNVVVDKQERPLDPLGVWLDLAARHERARDLRIVPIDDPRLLKLLELEPRPAPVRGGRANLYTFAEFAARMEEFEKERMRLNGPSADGTPQPAADPNALEYRRAVDDLGQRLALVFDLLRAFRGPSERSVEAFQSFQRDVQQLEQSSSVPAVIAPRTADERWLPYSTALWDKLRIEILGDDKRAPHPAVDVWNTLLTAWATADAPRVEALAPSFLRSPVRPGARRSTLSHRPSGSKREPPQRQPPRSIKTRKLTASRWPLSRPASIRTIAWYASITFPRRRVTRCGSSIIGVLNRGSHRSIGQRSNDNSGQPKWPARKRSRSRWCRREVCRANRLPRAPRSSSNATRIYSS